MVEQERVSGCEEKKLLVLIKLFESKVKSGSANLKPVRKGVCG